MITAMVANKSSFVKIKRVFLALKSAIARVTKIKINTMLDALSSVTKFSNPTLMKLIHLFGD